MNAYRLAVVIVMVTALQAGFLPAWHPFGIVPDLLAAVIVVLGLLTTASQTLICAMVGGLVLDLTSGTEFGLFLGLYTLTALGIALLVRLGIAFDSIGWRYGLASVAVLLAHVVVLVGLALHHVRLPVGVVAPRLAAGLILELLLVGAAHVILGRLVRAEPSLGLRGNE